MKSLFLGLALTFAGITAIAADKQGNDAGLYCTTVSACGKTSTMCVFSKGDLTEKQIQDAVAAEARELCKGVNPAQLEQVEPAF